MSNASRKGLEAAEAAAGAAEDADTGDKIAKAMSKVKVEDGSVKGFNAHVIDDAVKDLNGKPSNVFDMFGRHGKDSVKRYIEKFIVDAEDDQASAAKHLLDLAQGDEQKMKVLCSIAATLKPDCAHSLEKAAEAAGVAIDDYDLSQVGSAAKHAAKTAGDMTGQTAKAASDGLIPGLKSARLAGKAVKAILNNGKTAVDLLGSWKIARGEDKNVVASMDFLVELPDGVDAKKQDVKCSVRFDAGDMEWHAVCLDDRKLQLPEETIVKKALATPEGKKFR